MTLEVTDLDEDYSWYGYNVSFFIYELTIIYIQGHYAVQYGGKQLDRDRGQTSGFSI